MHEDRLIGLVMATMLEAEPFIRGLSLEGIETEPFPVYGNGRIRLIISGIGKANAAMACACFIRQYRPSCILNLGAAGSSTARASLGECYHIHRAVEPDRPSLTTGLPHVHAPDTLEGFSQATLATQDRPVRDPEERAAVSVLADLVDMEGASVAQACARFRTKCLLFKFVSDTPEHDGLDDIRNNIILYRDAFYGFFCERVLPLLLIF